MANIDNMVADEESLRSERIGLWRLPWK